MSAAELETLSRLLVTCGCPVEKAAAMAAQLDRRATQLAALRGRTHSEALVHLLGLMRQGWAAGAGGTGAGDGLPPAAGPG
jgi:hypothetical protein